MSEYESEAGPTKSVDELIADKENMSQRIRELTQRLAAAEARWEKMKIVGDVITGAVDDTVADLQQQLAASEARYVQLKAINDNNSESLLNEICKHTETQARLAAAEAERVTPETILAVAELHGTIYDLRQLLETAVDAMESNHDWQAHEFCKCGLRRHWYERAKQLTAEPSGNPGELPETIPVRFQEPTPMAPRTLQD